MSQGPSSVRASRGMDPKHGPTGLPLILCPICQEDKVTKLVSNTKMPHKCNFFKWLERYQAHLVETGVINMDKTFHEDAIPKLFEVTDNLRKDVKSMKGEIKELKDCIAGMKMSRENLGGKILKFVCGVNVVLVVLLVMVILWK